MRKRPDTIGVSHKDVWIPYTNKKNLFDLVESILQATKIAHNVVYMYNRIMHDYIVTYNVYDSTEIYGEGNRKGELVEKG